MEEGRRMAKPQSSTHEASDLQSERLLVRRDTAQVHCRPHLPRASGRRRGRRVVGDQGKQPAQVSREFAAGSKVVVPSDTAGSHATGGRADGGERIHAAVDAAGHEGAVQVYNEWLRRVAPLLALCSRCHVRLQY